METEKLAPNSGQSFQFQPENCIFSVRDLVFAYENNPQKTVLAGVTFGLAPGDCIGLAGSNGSGKTTLFKCITGLLKPLRGTVYLGRNILKEEDDFYNLRREVGFVLQNADDQLFFPSVLEDVAFGPLNLGFSEKMAAECARDALALVNLEGYEERLCHQLSGGEKKLVALAAILAMRPKALLLDEPLNELDPEAALRVAKIVADLQCARLVISHDIGFLEETCSQIWKLRAGRLEIYPA